MLMHYENSLDFARKQDEADPLKKYRDRFYIPQVNGKDCYYFTGNSLGLQPKSVRNFVEEELKAWEMLGVGGHFEGQPKPWVGYHKLSKEALARLAGGKPMEVVSMNSLTVNLHLLMVSFYKPTAQRYKIICEAGAFSSDQYMLESQLKFHGYDPDEALIELRPRQGEQTLRQEDIEKAIRSHGDSLALVLMGGVQYYTGQFFNLKAITKTTHEAGALAGFDLAHAFGNVSLSLHHWGVDFATWCSYKYLNSGPGNVSGIFVHERFAEAPELNRFAGWWGCHEAERFLMKKGFEAMPGADGWQLSNVNIIATAAHLASLEIFHEAGMEALRTKSLKLTGFMEFVINERSGEEGIFEIITPKNPEERGCQLSIFCHKNGKALFKALTAEGVVADWREPHVIRVAPVPLYNTFEDVYQFGEILKKALAKG